MFASTRIAVALCAAIAMVLGAMSVGANRRENAPLIDEPVAAAESPLANRVSTFDNSEGGANRTVDTLPQNNSHTMQQPLAVKPLKQPVLLANPKKPQVDISLAPIKTLITKEKIHIQLDAPVPALAPLVTQVPAEIPPAVNLDVSAPATGSAEEKGKATQPALQPTTETGDAVLPLLTDDQQQPLL